MGLDAGNSEQAWPVILPHKPLRSSNRGHTELLDTPRSYYWMVPMIPGPEELQQIRKEAADRLKSWRHQVNQSRKKRTWQAKEGDLICFLNRSRLARKDTEPLPFWKGPYRVIRRISQNVTEMRNAKGKGRVQIAHDDHVREYI